MNSQKIDYYLNLPTLTKNVIAKAMSYETNKEACEYLQEYYAADKDGKKSTHNNKVPENVIKLKYFSPVIQREIKKRKNLSDVFEFLAYYFDTHAKVDAINVG